MAEAGYNEKTEEAPKPMTEQEKLKREVGYRSVDEHVRSGMVVGLGTGSTAYYAIERVGQKLASGELSGIIGIPTSLATERHATSLNIPLSTLAEHSELDVSIDGADAVDSKLNLVKGGGGALLREKMVEISSKKFIVIVDESKLYKELGPGFPLPVEVTPFCWQHTMRVLGNLPSMRGGQPRIRRGNIGNNKEDGPDLAFTDDRNHIVDIVFDTPIADPCLAASELAATVGVVDHGLFCGMATEVIVAGKSGVYTIHPKEATETTPSIRTSSKLGVGKMPGCKFVPS